MRSDDFDSDGEEDLAWNLSDDEWENRGSTRVAAHCAPAANQLAAALEALEERLEAALERHTVRLIAAMRDRRPGVPMQAVETKESSARNSHSRPSIARGTQSRSTIHRPLGVQHSNSDLNLPDHDIIVEPTVEPVTSIDVGEFGAVRWQWQSSAGPWKDYEDSAHERIEAAYRRGESHVRLKSGLTGKVPMEIFLVDMVQRDPESKRVRKVRRRGPALTLHEKLLRYRSGLWRYMVTGRSMFESMQAYRDRTFGHSGYLDELQREDIQSSQSGDGLSQSSIQDQRVRQTCRRWVRGPCFSLLSAIVLLLQCWWIWYSTDDTVGIHLYQQGTPAIALEHFFCFFFAAEFAMNILALNKRRLWYLNPWLSLDAACVLSYILDVLLLPPLSLAAGFNLVDIPGGEVLRSLRLVKIFRICRIFAYSHTYSTIIKGMVGGMRSAALILAILAVVLLAFAVLMRNNSEHELLKAYFGSVPLAMRTLLTCGLFLDDVRELVEDMFEAGFWLPIIFFALFMYVTFFGLMSMLVGTFCSVADRVHQEEEDRLMTTRLRSSLRGIVECYIDDDSVQPVISRAMFRLLMKNPDVRSLLTSSQTDISGLKSVMQTLLANSDSEMPFAEMLDIIVHLRVGKAAAVSDVAHLEGVVCSSFERLEHLMLCGQPLCRQSDEPSSEVRGYPGADGMERGALLPWEASTEVATLGVQGSSSGCDSEAERQASAAG